MFKKIFTMVLAVTILATVVGVLPGLEENAAFACAAGNPGCDP